MEPVIKKITELDDDELNKITEWMFDWWGKNEDYSYEAVKCYIEHGLQEHRLPQTYGMYLDDSLIGIYQFRLDDLFVRPDLYPWLANVYIDQRYRHLGYGHKLMESIKVNAKQLNCNELYLYTKHTGLYERYGWEYVTEIDTYLPQDRIQRLYRLSII